MRIDKFLWAVRYFKTRNIASEACKKGMVSINKVKAKPSKEVYPMDLLEVRKNQINYTLEVLDLPPSRVAAKLVDIYRKDTTPKENLETAKVIQAAQRYYREKGSGRPTKKDRRDLDDYRTENQDEIDSD
jgi:ribosome-associated heat shock protein Hsp15